MRLIFYSCDTGQYPRKHLKWRVFATIAKGFLLLTIAGKLFIFDVFRDLDYASDYHKQTQSSGGVLEKKVLLKISQNSHENTCARACNFMKKETLAYVFSCEFCEIFKNSILKKTFGGCFCFSGGCFFDLTLKLKIIFHSEVMRSSQKSSSTIIG